jgi:hypothetical protein
MLSVTTHKRRSFSLPRNVGHSVPVFIFYFLKKKYKKFRNKGDILLTRLATPYVHNNSNDISFFL